MSYSYNILPPDAFELVSASLNMQHISWVYSIHLRPAFRLFCGRVSLRTLKDNGLVRPLSLAAT